MKKMKTPHDNLFRETFSRRENALSFLKIYLPPVLLEAVDLQSLEICKDSFIEKELEDYFFRYAVQGGACRETRLHLCAVGA